MSVLAGSAVVLGCGGCGPSTVPPYEVVYGRVLASVAQHLELNPPVLIHPLLGQLNEERGSVAPMQEFQVFDSVTVPSVVDQNRDLVRLCETTSSGTCVTSNDEPWVIVSEILSTGRDALVLVLIRSSGSQHPSSQLYRAFVRYVGARDVSVRLEAAN